jgi:lantibiotic modifying enzyme
VSEVAWTPILEAGMARRALDVARELVDHLAGDIARSDCGPSLAAGWAGIAILFAYADQAFTGHYADLASECLERAGAQVAASPMTPGLFSGFSGVAWATEHLRGRILDGTDDPNADIDEALEQLLTVAPAEAEDYELTRGLVGLGVYALSRPPAAKGAALAARILHLLEQQSERQEPGITWWTPPHRGPLTQDAPQGLYDLGVAHGVAGVIALHARAIQAGHAGGRARDVLAGAMDWLLANRLPGRGESLFPSVRVKDQPAAPTRLAWCYGDAGIAAAVLAAGLAADEPSWVAAAHAIAERAIQRPYQNTGVVDAGLCHGAAGLAHTFNRLWQATRHPACLEAARVWYQRTLALRRPEEGGSGYLAYQPVTRRWEPVPGLLEGAAGIALALLAAATDIEPAWDEMLLVRLPIRAEAPSHA